MDRRTMKSLYVGGGTRFHSLLYRVFCLIEVFNNLASWGEKKFVSEQKRTYKFKREVKSTSRAAFTLAEVLITLGIIGVVAAITLSSLIQNNIEKQRVAQLKKAYSALSQAFTMAVSENGDPTYWGMTGMYDENSHYIFADNMRKHLKLSVDCVDMTEAEARKVCGHEDKIGKNTSNDGVYSDISEFINGRGVILSDGTTVAFRIFDGQCNLQQGAIKNVCGTITVDVNGSKYPNQNGYDQFAIYITKDRLVPYGIKGDSLTFERACNLGVESPYPEFWGATTMYSCTAWVLYNGNMDYLHCNDLSWEGKHSCKEK